jgi:hypothetical protein
MDLATSRVQASSPIFGLLFHLHRPVVIRQAPLGQAAKKWSLEGLLRPPYGGLEVEISGIPYSSKYLSATRDAPLQRRTTLGTFITDLWGMEDERGSPLYLFTKSTTERMPEILEDIDVPAYLMPAVNASRSFTFYLGPVLSGSPFHEHIAAWNALVLGTKLWVLAPPDTPIASRRPVCTLLTRDALSHREDPASSSSAMLPPRDEGRSPDVTKLSPDRLADYTGVFAQEDNPPIEVIQLVQNAGDIVLIPPHWSHAVANLTAVCGLASEFG